MIGNSYTILGEIYRGKTWIDRGIEHGTSKICSPNLEPFTLTNRTFQDAAPLVRGTGLKWFAPS